METLKDVALELLRRFVQELEAYSEEYGYPFGSTQLIQKTEAEWRERIESSSTFQQMEMPTTVGGLIAELSKFPPGMTVGAQSSGCCTHAHEILRIRQRTEDDWQDEAEVIIEV